MKSSRLTVIIVLITAALAFGIRFIGSSLFRKKTDTVIVTAQGKRLKSIFEGISALPKDVSRTSMSSGSKALRPIRDLMGDLGDLVEPVTVHAFSCTVETTCLRHRAEEIDLPCSGCNDVARDAYFFGSTNPYCDGYLKSAEIDCDTQCPHCALLYCASC